MKMAAYKGSDEDIQHLSVAQLCKCENRCIDYLELQSELNEVRLIEISERNREHTQQRLGLNRCARN